MLTRYVLLFLSVVSTTFLAQAQCDVQPVIEPDTDETILCPGEQITLTVPGDFTSFQWYYVFSDQNFDGFEFEGETNASITLNVIEWAASHFYCVVSGEGGCVDTTATFFFDGWVFAPIAIAHDMNTELCPGDSSLIENAFNGPTTFVWFKDFEPIPGANQSFYWVTEPGYYTLQASYPQCPNYFLNSGLGPEFTEATTFAVSIAFDGETLSTSANGGLQWYLNGEEIEGATSSTYTPQEDGIYSVAQTQGPCLVFSDPLNVSVSALNTIQVGELKIFPNPVEGWLYISRPEGVTDAEISVYDVTGRMVYSRQVFQWGEANSLRLDLGGLTSGLYAISLQTTESTRYSAAFLVK